ncbi:helix-turn-helix transcriptional regulator [Aquihabitans sp. G128]|uniref:winged helix-turn-helix transcriptional regulator n=1 Tax=Aquihabitans sp. G128 TaxID=2849779 RepID=UPI001C210582|nr:helix-turn-helix domain-containing protein [Aquihabitans sp. G128]QXC60919.1 helix-turn-helix transcriptional regulator [Aquihabitans sp. G128]
MDEQITAEEHGADGCAAVDCDALGAVFSLLGKRWNGLIIGTLLAGPARFSELARTVPGVSERMLADRLGELAHCGLVDRDVDDGPPVSVRYALTAKGQALRPALLALGDWADEHLGTAAHVDA